jgi:hypothetical protein
MTDFNRQLFLDPVIGGLCQSITDIDATNVARRSRCRINDNSHRMIRAADGQLVNDVRGAASKSTGKRRNRLNGNASSYDWRSGKHFPRGQYNSFVAKPKPNTGTYKVTEQITASVKTHIEYTTRENISLLPYLAFNLIVFAATPIECQKLIDRINTKCYDKTDPHVCSPDVPCSIILKRVTDSGKLDYKAGVHVCAMDIYLIQKTYNYSKNFDKNCIIIPSWHSNLIDNWKRKCKSCSISYPISGFDLNILHDMNVKNHFEKMRKYLKDGERLYVIANIFGSDNPKLKDQIKDFYEIDIQLTRGHVDIEDEIKAGINISTKINDIPYAKLEEVGRYAAIRETAEETDQCIVIPDEMISKLELIYDFQQLAKDGRYNRGMVYCFDHPVDVNTLINMDRVAM